MRLLIALGLLAATWNAAGQQMYRCGSSFSQTPCGAGQQVLGKPAPSPVPDTPASPETVAAAKAQCVARLTTDVVFKDPESVKITDIDRGGVWQERGVPTRMYLMRVNAKNSYGAYAGPENYLCLTSVADERRVLWVRPATKL